MLIQNITFRNFKSFGAALQTITFNPNGELILLAGKNGAGKSAIKDAIEYALFGKVSGKKKKFLAVKNVINRTNHTDLHVGINFINNNGQNISIKRTIAPNILNVTIDGIDKSDEFSNYSDKEKNKLIGFTYEVFKSFISMSMKNFEDFLQLTDSKKEELLNKLFQLEHLVSIQSLVKELSTKNSNTFNFQSKRKEALFEELNNIKKILSALPDIEKIDLKIQDVKNKIITYKQPFIDKENQCKNIETQIKEINNKIKTISPIKNEYENQLQKMKWDNEQLKTRLELFKDGKCPHCLTNLTDHNHIQESKLLNETININKENIQKQIELIEKCTLEEIKMLNQKKSYNNQLNTIKLEFDKIKQDIIDLKHEKEILIAEKGKDLNVEDLKSQYRKAKTEYLDVKSKLEKLEKKQEHYNILLEMFKGTTLRQHMINQMLPSVNFYLQEFLKKIDLPCNVTLDDEFNAILKERDEIDPETTSKGEDRKINLSIALSYLCALLDNNPCNLLFLDEVFDGIDVENVDLILKILKEITVKYKVNIIIIHHNIMDKNHFDRIIKVKKTHHSDITETILKK